MKEKRIEFSPILSHFSQTLVAAKSKIPNWYKDARPIDPIDSYEKYGYFISNFKHCMPFLDSFTTGYLITLPCDIYFKKNNNKYDVWWKEQEFRPIVFRINEDNMGINKEIPIPNGCDQTQFTWVTPLTFKLPMGYSALVTHPFNRFDLPFNTLTGVIDGGWAASPYINLPFFIKNNFEGEILAGTPIAQILPFKNEKWISIEDKNLMEEGMKNLKASNALFTKWYKNNIWNKKEYL